MGAIKISSRIKLPDETTFGHLRAYARGQSARYHLAVAFHTEHGGTDIEPACTNVLGVLNSTPEAVEPFRRSILLSEDYNDVHHVMEDARYEVETQLLARHYGEHLEIGEAYDTAIEHRSGMADFNSWRWIQFQRELDRWQSNHYRDEPPSWNATWQTQNVGAFLSSIGVRRLGLIPRTLPLLLPSQLGYSPPGGVQDVVEYPSYLRSGVVVRFEARGVGIALDHVQQLSTEQGDWAVIRGKDRYGLMWARVLDASPTADAIRLVPQDVPTTP